MDFLYIGVDNTVVLENVRSSRTHAYINDATIRLTLYRLIAEDGVTVAASTTMTSATAGFVSGDVGKSIIIPAAGAQRSDLKTTIATYVSATEVTLTDAPTFAVTYAQLHLSVPGATSVLMTYLADTNGKYTGTIASTVALSKGELYCLAVTIDGGSDREDYRQINIGATYRS